MKWGPVLGTTVFVILMILFQWSRLNPNQKKEKAALITLSVSGWLLAIVLILFPDTSGPTEFINWLYKPLGKLLEK